MHIVRNTKKGDKINYHTVLLRESYRDELGKPRKRTILNLSHLPEDLISSLDKILKGGKVVNLNDKNVFHQKQGKSYGAIRVISEIMKRIGITKALGKSSEAAIIMILIAGIIISRRKSKSFIANRWSLDQAIEEVFGYSEEFNENDIYRCLSYLSENQSKIEKKLWKARCENAKLKERSVFLYDITSSYVEGDQIAFSEYGYNRDKKKGKKQIVVGLLTDDEGMPLSIEVFEGNERDFKTVSGQLNKLQRDFGVSRVIFVGDRGMIKSKQIEAISSLEWGYITGMTRPQIEKLINDEVIQLEIFDEDLMEIEYENERYIFRKNPLRAEEMQISLMERIKIVKDHIEQKNRYLEKHKRAKTEVAIKSVETKIEKLKLSKYISFSLSGRVIDYEENTTEIEEYCSLAGCYALRTNVGRELLTKKEVHSRYKDLYEVESDFRMLKTDFLEIRPIFVRKEEHVKGHVFACMLSLMVLKYLKQVFKKTNLELDFILQTLDKIQYTTIFFQNQPLKSLPCEYSNLQTEILEKLKIRLPTTL